MFGVSTGTKCGYHPKSIECSHRAFRITKLPDEIRQNLFTANDTKRGHGGTKHAMRYLSGSSNNCSFHPVKETKTETGSDLLVKILRELDQQAKALMSERVGADPMTIEHWESFCRAYPNLLHPIFKIQRMLQVLLFGHTLRGNHNHKAVVQ